MAPKMRPQSEVGTNAYWREREAEADKHVIRDEEKLNKEFRRIYKDVQEDMTARIHENYSRYAKAEGITMEEARKRVSEMDIRRYERLAARIVREKDFSPEANEQMRLYNATMRINRLEYMKSQLGLEMVKAGNDVQGAMQEVFDKTAMDEYRRMSGILSKSTEGSLRWKRKATALVNASFHHATWSERVWADQGYVKNNLDRELTRAIMQGMNPRTIASSFAPAIQSGCDNARMAMERLARTEMRRIRTDVQRMTFDEYGFTEYEYIANERDMKTCPICEAMNGEVFKVKDMMIGENAPPMHPNCRCSIAAHMSEQEMAEYYEWLNNFQYENEEAEE